jgi:hypothetical protein
MALEFGWLISEAREAPAVRVRRAGESVERQRGERTGRLEARGIGGSGDGVVEAAPGFGLLRPYRTGAWPQQAPGFARFVPRAANIKSGLP